MTVRQCLISVLLALNIAFYVLYLYFPLLSFGYIWDDLALLKQALEIPLETSLQPAMFVGTNFFRPAGYASFLVESRLFGVSPLTSHAINIGLHIVAVLQLYVISIFLLRHSLSFGVRLLVSAALSLAVGSLPVMAEPVAWVSARFELLCAIFLLAAIMSITMFGAVFLRMLGLFVFFLLALFSKEAALPFVFVVVLNEAAMNYRQFCLSGLAVFRAREIFLQMATTLVAVVIYLFVREFLIGQSLVTVNTIESVSDDYHFRLVIESIYQYFLFFVKPWQALLPYYVVEAEGGLGALPLLTAVFCSVLVLVSAAFALQKRGSVYIVPLVFTAMLLPVLNIVPVFPGLFSVAPRYVYLPIFMAVISLVICLRVSAKRNSKALIVIAFLAFSSLVPGFFATRDFLRNYESNEVFWDAVIAEYGVYTQLVAINGIKSKMAVAKYDDAYERLMTAREKFEFPESYLDSQDIALSYYRATNSIQAIEKIDARLEELLSASELLTDLPGRNHRYLVWLLNMKALLLNQRCDQSNAVVGYAESALRYENNIVSSMVLSAVHMPELFLIFGYMESVNSPFSSEYKKEIERLVKRDLRRCLAGVWF